MTSPAAATRPRTADRVMAMYPWMQDDVPAIEQEAVAAERARILARAEAYWAADFIDEEEWDRIRRFVSGDAL